MNHQKSFIRQRLTACQLNREIAYSVDSEAVSEEVSKVLPLQDKRAVCFAVLLVLLLTLAIVQNGPTIQEKEDLAALLSSSERGPANNLLAAPEAPVGQHYLFSVRSPIPFSRLNSIIPASLPQSYGQSSLAFEANQGQTDSRVKFLSRGAGYALFFT